jgi:alkylhydroperoxidase family enzyme
MFVASCRLRTQVCSSRFVSPFLLLAVSAFSFGQGTKTVSGQSPAPAIAADAAAWKALPPVQEGSGQPLPAWIRALAPTLPQTAAAMIDLDYAQRVDNPLPPRLRALLRWVAADANRCAYGKAYAREDYERAGGRGEELDHLEGRLARLSEAERLAVRFVRQLTEAAYTVRDDQVQRLAELYGEKQLVAIVLVAAYANFQDRLVESLQIQLAANEPLPPLRVRFRQPAPAAGSSTSSKVSDAPKPKRSLPAASPPPVPTRLEDPGWTAVPFEELRTRVTRQTERRQARIAVPDWETVRPLLPPENYPPDKPLRIRWSLLAYGYQPRLTGAWVAGLRAYHRDTDLDEVQLESMFWVVTRSLRCFY